jgi:hypothetical protein
MTTLRVMGFAALVGLAGCDGGPVDGTVEVRIWGEEFVEDGIPAEVFVDGWSVRWDAFLVAVDGVATPAAEDPTRYLFDLAEPSGGAGHVLGSLTSPGGVTELAYRIGPGARATAGNAAADDVARMEAMGWSLFVAGTATRAAESVAFAWGFATTTHYRECQAAEDVEADEIATTVITIHADHLFYDDLDSEAPNVAFDLVAAADADTDGAVTLDELAATDITGESRYQVGSRDIADLEGFIAAQTSTLGHIDGEGHCETER